MHEGQQPSRGITLEVRHSINATPERLFDAWTDPAQLVAWWGPEGVVCIGAQVDLRVGGKFRIGNRLPDGAELWIAGEFVTIDPPHMLRYTWLIEGTMGSTEMVTVRFEPRNSETEVVVQHERIPDAAAREQHACGWEGCLDGLAELVA